MNVNEREEAFKPVIITLESQAEVNQLAGIVRWDWNVDEHGVGDPLEGLFESLHNSTTSVGLYHWAKKARDRAATQADYSLEV